MIWFDFMIHLRSPLQTQEWPAPLFFYSCKPTCLAVRSPSPPWKRCSFNFRFSGHIHWIFNIIWENQYQRFYFKCQWWYGWISPPGDRSGGSSCCRSDCGSLEAWPEDGRHHRVQVDFLRLLDIIILKEDIQQTSPCSFVFFLQNLSWYCSASRVLSYFFCKIWVDIAVLAYTKYKSVCQVGNWRERAWTENKTMEDGRREKSWMGLGGNEHRWLEGVSLFVYLFFLRIHGWDLSTDD